MEQILAVVAIALPALGEQRSACSGVTISNHEAHYVVEQLLFSQLKLQDNSIELGMTMWLVRNEKLIGAIARWRQRFEPLACDPACWVPIMFSTAAELLHFAGLLHIPSSGIAVSLLSPGAEGAIAMKKRICIGSIGLHVTLPGRCSQAWTTGQFRFQD